MKNKIDRLFQDKLARHKVNPTEHAWEQVKTELDGESHRKIWFAIAASVSILAVSTFLIFKSSEDSQIESSANFLVDHPAPIAAFEWDLSERKNVSEVKKYEMKNKQTKESSDAGSLAKKIDKEPLIKKMIAVIEVPEVLKQETTDPSTIEELPLLNPLEITTSVVIEEDKKPIFDSQVAELPQLQVQITYKADASPSVLEEDKTRVGKLLAKARQIRPGEMLASIRETKNDFFNGKKN